jgi:hypothetical protein
MKVTRHQAKQIHPVPDRVMDPQGPFSRELLAEPEINYAFDNTEYGGDFSLGATAQNDFKPAKVLRCGSCLSKVLETETKSHVCEE